MRNLVEMSHCPCTESMEAEGEPVNVRAACPCFTGRSVGRLGVASIGI